EGTTAMHFASARISVGIPLSGVPMISSSTLAEEFSRFAISVFDFESSVVGLFSNLAVLDFFVCDGLGLGVGFEVVVVGVSFCDQARVAIANVITNTSAARVTEYHLEFIRGPLLLVQMVR